MPPIAQLFDLQRLVSAQGRAVAQAASQTHTCQRQRRLWLRLAFQLQQNIILIPLTCSLLNSPLADSSACTGRITQPLQPLDRLQPNNEINHNALTCSCLSCRLRPRICQCIS